MAANINGTALGDYLYGTSLSDAIHGLDGATIELHPHRFEAPAQPIASRSGRLDRLFGSTGRLAQGRAPGQRTRVRSRAKSGA